MAREDQPGVLPALAGREPLAGLAAGPGAERLDGGRGEGEGAAGPFGLGLVVGADDLQTAMCGGTGGRPAGLDRAGLT